MSVPFAKSTIIDTLDYGKGENGDEIEELTSTKLKLKEYNVAQIGKDMCFTSTEKVDDSATIALAGLLGKIANAITNQNNLLENERRKCNDLLLGSLSLTNQIRDLKLKNVNVLLPEQTDSIRTITVRTDFIKAAEHYNNRGNKKAAKAIGTIMTKTYIGNTNALKFNKTMQNKNNRHNNKAKQQSSEPRDAVAEGVNKRRLLYKEPSSVKSNTKSKSREKQ